MSTRIRMIRANEKYSKNIVKCLHTFEVFFVLMN